jgi:tetratricopeptide (TPR) repeat protein
MGSAEDPLVGPQQQGDGPRQASPVTLDAHALPIGSLLGDRFEIECFLGQGGMGSVYRALDRRGGSRVAIKTVRSNDQESIARLKVEWRRLADIRDPNLVEIYDFGSTSGFAFFTMELIEGVDILSFCARKRLHPSQAMRETFAQLLGGISRLHARGLLHRDLKPSNVMVDGRGRVVILDFGIAHELGRRPPASSTFAGTPEYMSPEQLAGSPLDRSSDLYSVGLIFFEALTGELPFRGSLGERLERERSSEAIRPSGGGDSVPPDLDALCCALLAPNPGHRPSADQALRMLGAEPDASRSRVHPDTPFVGRIRELARLEKELTTDGTGCCIALIRGTSGVGKTTLVLRYTEALEATGTLVLSGRCHERASVPYKALDCLIEPLVRYLKDLPQNEAAALLPRKIESLARVFPAFLRVPAVRLAVAPSDLGDDPRALRLRALAALKDLLGRISERARVVLWIDDVQWGDADSASLLRLLLDPPDHPNIALILTFRSETSESCEFLKTFRGREFDTAIRIVLLEVAPLDVEESHALVVAIAPHLSPDVARAIARESSGLPLFVAELTGAQSLPGSKLGDAAGPSLENVLMSRVASLQPADRRLLNFIALAGRPLERELILQAASVGPTGTAALTRLAADHLILSHGDDLTSLLEPFHDRVRETVAGALLEDQTLEIHTRFSQVLTETRPEHRELRAVHLAHSGERVQAAGVMIEAAAIASEALAFDHATALYRNALVLMRQVNSVVPTELLERCADACTESGLYDLAAELYRERLSAVVNEGERAELLRRTAEVEFRRGRTLAAARTLEAMIRSLGFRIPRSSIGVTTSNVLQLLQTVLCALVPWISRGLVGAEARQKRALLVKLHGRLAEAYYWTDYPRAVFYQLSSMNLARRLGASAELAFALTQQSLVLATFGLTRRSQVGFARARRMAEAAASRDARAWEGILRGLGCGCRADARGQVAECKRIEELLRDSLETLRLRQAWVIAAEGLLALGEPREAEQYGRRVQEMAAQLADPRGAGWGAYLVGHAWMRMGRWQEGAERLAEAVSLCERSGDAVYRITAMARLSLTLALLGRTSEAVRLGFGGASEYQSRRLRHNTCCADGVFLGVVALACLRAEDPSPETLLAARRTARRRGRISRNLLYTRPLFLAGLGAWHISEGKVARGWSELEQASVLARGLKLNGELYDVLHLTAALLEPIDGRRAEILAEAERISLG